MVETRMKLARVTNELEQNVTITKGIEGSVILITRSKCAKAQTSTLQSQQCWRHHKAWHSLLCPVCSSEYTVT